MVRIVTLLVCLASLTSPTRADVIFDIQEVGNDVVMTAEGSYDLSAFTFLQLGAGPSIVDPTNGFARVGSFSSIESHSGTVIGPAFGTGNTTLASSGTGDVLGFLPALSRIDVPENYVSGMQLSGTATWSNQDFSSLGINQGTYVYTAGNDTITVNFGDTTAVPEPSTWALLTLAGIGFAGYRLRKRMGIMNV